VELASLANPAWFAQKVASILGVHESIGKSLVDNLIAYLQHKHMLLLLDNCEHLIEACAQIVGTLIARCRHLAILATSREPLRVTGEVALLVSPLVTPDLHHLPSLKELSQTEAVDLFLDRARSVQSNFTLTMHNASAIAQICCRLDGIPLAIELAAARVRVLSAAQIAARLDDAFRLLVGGSRTAPTRQQTLQASLNWSHQLLYEKERVLFRRVAVFAGGFSLEAAEHICSGDGIKPCEVLDQLTKLVDKSLILVHEQGRLVRYHLLEMVRQYALVKFLKSSDEDEVRGRHLYFFLNLAEKYVNSGSPEEEDSLYHRLEMELENLRVALEWSRSALGHGEGKGDIVVEAGLRLAGSLWWFWYMRGYLSEGSEWLQIFLEKSSGEPNYARAKALLASGGLAWRQGRIDQAEAACTESLALCRTLGDKFGIAFSLGTLGVVAFLREDYAKAYSLHSEALAIRRELGINRYIAYSLGNLGVVVLAQGGIRQAEGLCEEGLTLSRKSRFQWTFNDLLNKRGIVALARGDYTLAVSLFKQSLSRQQEAGDRWNIAYSLEGIACVAVTQGKPERAAWIWGAAEALREVINSPLPPAYREIYELFVVTAKASLNEEAFKEVRSEGQELTMEQAIAFALA
jgi:non-specific serine/threonine protein kinase